MDCDHHSPPPTPNQKFRKEVWRYPDSKLKCYRGYITGNPKKRHGQGIAYHRNGSKKYVGEWSQNNRQGKGIEFDQRNRVMYKGFWKQNQKNGYGAAYDADGRIFM
jgi:antitoxin component YwqK of YwqJK toxin-antitoxin module